MSFSARLRWRCLEYVFIFFFFLLSLLTLSQCLLPVANVPMINYTIESLAANGVEEIFVFCCSHAEKIEEHIRHLVQSARLPDVSIRCVVSKDSNTIGDALRAVYQMGILSDDFFLVYGDVVSNAKLSALVSEHQLRRSKDKQAIMTLMLAPCRAMRTPALKTPALPTPFVEPAHTPAVPKRTDSPAIVRGLDNFDEDYDDGDEHSTEETGADSDDDDEDDDDDVGGDSMSENAAAVRRRGGDGTARRVVLLDAASGHLLHYADASAVSSNQLDMIEMDVALFENRPRLTFRHDLEEVGIAVCTADVLFQFNDNFDYTNVPQFVRGVVNEEILSCRVYAFVDQVSYSSRASSLRRYQHVSWDILQRWTYPFIPDTNLVTCGANDANYSFVRDGRGGPGVYLQRPVHMARSAIVSGAAALRHPEVVKQTQFEKLPSVPSVVGEQSQIGAGAVVLASVIGRNCRIGQNAVVICSHLWDGVEIGDGAVVVGSLVASHSRVGTRCTIRQGSVISFRTQLPANTVVPPLSKICPASLAPTASAVGLSLKPFQQLESVRQLGAAPIPFNELVRGWEPQLQTVPAPAPTTSRQRDQSSGSDGGSEVSDELASSSTSPRVVGDGDSDQDGEVESKVQVSDIEKFRAEVGRTVVRAVTGGHKMETLVLEVNSLKYAYDASFLESAGSIFDGLMSTLDASLSVKSLTSLLTKWGPVFAKFLMDEEEQTEFVFRIQEFCEREGNAKFVKFFQNMLHTLYDVDVLTEDAIIAWADEQQESGEDLQFVSQCKKLLEWLRASGSEDE